MSEQEIQFLKKHKAKIIFSLLFILIGILFMTLGFLKTMFVLLLAIAGWFFGKIVDDKELIRRFINNYLGK
ncbi:MAG TPA: DUF2273 domain-containing protein [bacterium]|nr:DUF2273 domain-containing protein [bacterium]